MDNFSARYADIAGVEISASEEFLMPSDEEIQKDIEVLLDRLFFVGPAERRDMLIKHRREVYVEACVAAADAIRRNRIARGNYSSNWEQGFNDGLKWAEDDALMIPAREEEVRGVVRAHIDDCDFEIWWEGTKNENWFSGKPITLKSLKETAYCAWRAARAAKK